MLLVTYLFSTILFSCNKEEDTREVSISYVGVYIDDVTLHIKRDIDSLEMITYTSFEDSLYNPNLYLTQDDLNNLSSQILKAYSAPSDDLEKTDSGYLILIERGTTQDTLLFYELNKFDAIRNSITELSPENQVLLRISDHVKSVKDIAFRY